ncbi:triose-phosphate isomerase [Campylobacter sp. VicNov18]|uniref:triose-phosphate isomerase n=1 Tax=Campylobacter bilis TaxID=2691918 RepID=UPI00130E08B7|nr:triose-phosphate isomerase [Campylobacter bilis]MPV64083.1 triose-phosphate isomerase [Campylobacter hepaticus]MBM0637586.1 triose-phosphate isomerase [Campylobacter bilis]MCC8278312.1 triose-phosphate isomerase [Campylobacter bilis]MCC8299816.1 triose-phosphate isomerase [Campylobacter bilis]MCC8301221.1 triose-phosphate isomerase [Campylobacter bilis]
MIFAANLKCNHTRSSFRIYADALNKAMGRKCDDIIVFPPSVAFLENKVNFVQGTQNFYPCIKGSFTGELGKEQLDEFGIGCVLIGHSERRVLGDDSLIKFKFDFAKEHDYKIVFCIGEDLKTKNSAKTLEFLEKQLQIIDLKYEKLIIAYEPIYSIGTGVSADFNDISKVLEFLATLTKVPLLYGGSVNETNIKDILTIKHCKGVLIGSAALKVENFIKLIKG